MLSDLKVEQTGSNESGVCECCGCMSHSIGGLVSSHGVGVAAYFIHWTSGHVLDRGANIDIIVGSWGKDTVAADRCAIALVYRITDTGPGMMVIDAERRSFSQSDLVGKALKRDEVVGTPVAQQTFVIADAILAQDERVNELFGSWVLEEGPREK